MSMALAVHSKIMCASKCYILF